MLLRSKKNSCIYDVTTEYNEQDFEIYAELKQIPKVCPNRDNVRSFAWVYTNIKNFNEDWEDVD